MGEPSARRVLSVIHGPVFGGAHNQLVRLAPGLAAAGFETIALLPDGADEAAARIEAAGIAVLRVPLSSFRATADPRALAGTVANLPRDVAALRRAISKTRADVVQVHGVINPHAGIAGHREAAAVVWQLLDTRAPMALRRATMPYVVRRADAITSWGNAVAAAHPGATLFGERLVAVYPPVDPALAPDADERTRARERLGVEPGSPLVGTLGVRNTQKGHEHFVRAAARVAAERGGVVFRILGASSPGHAEHMEAVEREAAALGLKRSRQIDFVDPGGQATTLLQALDVFVLTSVPNSEGMPTAILEAMACAKPVVTTDVGAVRELVEDGVTGTVVPPGDDEAIAAAVLALLSDPARRERMGQAGLERARSEFTLDQLAELHSLAYRRAIEHRRSR